MHNGVIICVRPDFLLVAVLALFLLPLQWVIGWAFASLIHEVSHIVATYAQKVRIVSISIRASGAVIKTEPMSFYQEFISALAGPVGGLSSIVFLRIMPEITICAFLQSAFNLLPAYPLDGGRALKCAVSYLSSESQGESVSKYLTWIVTAFISIISIWILFNLRVNSILPIGILVMNMVKNSLQRQQNDSTILSNFERT